MNNNKQQLKYSILNAVIKPFWIISDNLRIFFIQSIMFSFIVLMLSYIFNQKYSCYFNQDIASSIHCPQTFYWYMPYILLKLILTAIFINLWYDSVFKKTNINIEYFKLIWKKILKTLVFIFGFILFNTIPFISALLLVVRVPNPNWKIELSYFTIVSLGFLLPIILMRFYGLFAQILAQKKKGIYAKLWENTSGFTMKIIFSCFLMFMINLIIILAVIGILKGQANIPAQLYNMFSEIIFAIAYYFIIVLFTNFCEVQRQSFINE